MSNKMFSGSQTIDSVNLDKQSFWLFPCKIYCPLLLLILYIVIKCYNVLATALGTLAKPSRRARPRSCLGKTQVVWCSVFVSGYVTVRVHVVVWFFPLFGFFSLFGIFLENDFWPPPPPINFENGS